MVSGKELRKILDEQLEAEFELRRDPEFMQAVYAALSQLAQSRPKFSFFGNDHKLPQLAHQYLQTRDELAQLRGQYLRAVYGSSEAEALVFSLFAKFQELGDLQNDLASELPLLGKYPNYPHAACIELPNRPATLSSC